MRALILSDIHANLDALEAVLAAAPQHDAVWNLGDTVGYGACPNDVVESVRELGRVFVRGNHDRACSGLLSLEEFNPVASEAVEWTRRELTEENLQWLRALPQGPIEPMIGVSCMHGAPLDEDEYLFSMEDGIAALGAADARVNFFGHTHVQGGFAVSDGEWFRLFPQYATMNEPEQEELTLRRGARYLLNPGSVGQPRDGDWRAAFAVYDDETPAVTFFRVPYNVGKAQLRIERAGLPERLAARLRRGQ